MGIVVKEQPFLFDGLEDKEGWEQLWEAEWQDMPEYKQENLEPFRTLYIHFKCQADVDDFSEKINQKIHSEQKSYWHPNTGPRFNSDMVYVDEEDEHLVKWEGK